MDSRISVRRPADGVAHFRIFAEAADGLAHLGSDWIIWPGGSRAVNLRDICSMMPSMRLMRSESVVMVWLVYHTGTVFYPGRARSRPRLRPAAGGIQSPGCRSTCAWDH